MAQRVVTRIEAAFGGKCHEDEFKCLAEWDIPHLLSRMSTMKSRFSGSLGNI
jgi:hypothetical protein